MEHLYSLLEKLNTQNNVEAIEQSGIKEFYIKLRNPILVENIQIVDLKGAKNKTNFKQLKNHITIDMSEFNSGTYLIKLYSKQGMECHKIFKN